MELYSLNAVFERRLLRIPDYQRGYAWQDHQIKDFLEDIIRLDKNKIHYTGVVTLELVKESIWGKWEQDKWMIDGMEYRPFYIVDGQQRLITSMILMQAIIERIELEEKATQKEIQLSYQSICQIRNRYISQKTDSDEKESFLFGYEENNPSDKFLKTHIFDDDSSSDSHQKPPETLYTQNLLKAKEYFAGKLKDMEVEEIEAIFKKLTQKLKFNLYKIDSEVDTFVAFETMNNRGKKLTSLELLKSRLIYLSTLFGNDAGEELRPKINDAWKTIYGYLGKNSKKPLDDDEFLRNHWIMYFGYSSEGTYRDFLLDKKFIAQNIARPKEKDRLEVKDINAYVESLKRSAEPWFYIHNPYYKDEDFSKFSDEKNKKLLDRLNRLGFRSFKPLLLASYISKKDIEGINQLLKVVERCNFTVFELSRYRANTGESKFYGYAKKVKEGMQISEVISDLNKDVERYHDDPKYFSNYIEKKYKIYKTDSDSWCEDGFFTWGGLPYFLYEYEEWLRDEGNKSTNKLEWGNLSKEHILPQTASDTYWEEHFGKFEEDQKIYLTHSLGNLLPLSGSENSSLGNKDFSTKKNNGKGDGYYRGSASEEKVAENKDWTAKEILERGLEMLKFMEERWEIELGDEKSKRRLLHLDFLPED